MAEAKDLREGGGVKTSLMEAGAHLWLAEELRSCASILTDGGSDPRLAAEQLEMVAEALHAEGAAQRWETGESHAYGGNVLQASRAASCVHRARQLRQASKAISEYAVALRHGGARGWTTVFGRDGVHACDPSVVPLLLSLADSETALARSKARPQSRPGAGDHAHAALDEGDGPGLYRSAAVHAPQKSIAATHLRRRLVNAGEELTRDASLVADAAPMLPQPPPDTARIAARVLAGGGLTPFQWRSVGYSAGGTDGYVAAEAWGSTIHPKHGGQWLGGGYRWRGGRFGDGSDSDEEAYDSEDERLEERAMGGWRAIRVSKRLNKHWNPENGTCVRCVERHVAQAPTMLAR